MTGAVADIDGFKQFIRDRARETWDQRGTPYYLSFLATDLKNSAGVDYRDFVAPLRLSQWAASNEVPDTTLVVHPTQRARIGFVPNDSGFEFDVEEPVAEPKVKPEGPSGKSRALIQFVQSLSHLPESALENFSVPAKTLIALLKI